MKILKRVNEDKSAKIDGKNVYYDKLGGGISISSIPAARRNGKPSDLIVAGIFISSSNKLELYKELDYDINEITELQKTNPKEFEKRSAKREKDIEADNKKVLETIKRCMDSFEKDLKASLAKLGYKE